VRRWVYSLAALMIVGLLLAWAVVPRVAAGADQVQTGRLRVATKPLEPFVV